MFAAAAGVGGVAVAAVLHGVSATPKLALSGAAGLAAVLVSVQRLGFGLAVLVVLTYTHGFIVIKEHGDVPSAALPFAALIVVIAFFTPERRRPFLPRAAEAAVVAFAAYGVWLAASATWAQDPGLTLRAAWAYAKLMVMVVAVLALVRTPHRLAIALWAIIGAAGILAAMTVAQHFDSGLTFFGFAQPPVGELTSTGEVTRAVGPIGSANAYAQMLVVAIPLAVARFRCESRLALRLAAAVAIVVSIIAIALTYSRGGFVSLAVVIALCIARFRPAVAVLALAMVVIIVGLGVASGSYGSRLGTLRHAFPWTAASDTADPSLVGRAAFLRAGLHIWREHPLGGVGYANFPLSYDEYNRHVGTDPTLGDSPHDTPLEVLSETGVVGLALWLLLFAAAFTSLWRARANAGHTADFLAISLAGYLATSLFIGGAYVMLAWLLLALCFAVRAALVPQPPR
jgi:O-antigen ligase